VAVVSLLDGQLAAAFAGVFGGIYLDGSLYRARTFEDDGKGGQPVRDPNDDGFLPAEAVKVQVDQATQAMRAAHGYVEGDVRILMLAHGVAAPDTDCECAAGGARYMIASVATDPAGSYYELRGRKK
jgi:hypothetical protein